ncbi:hypothetical protein ACEQ8H_000418 [Pleosporales sp. CAS-2024a]
MTTRTLIVFGAGPGIGNVHILLSPIPFRPPTKLACSTSPPNSPPKESTTSSSSHATRRASSKKTPHSSPTTKVDTVRIDLSDLVSLPSVLEHLDALTRDESVEVIFFNAARIKSDPVLAIPLQELDEDFRPQPSS